MRISSPPPAEKHMLCTRVPSCSSTRRSSCSCPPFFWGCQRVSCGASSFWDGTGAGCIPLQLGLVEDAPKRICFYYVKSHLEMVLSPLFSLLLVIPGGNVPDGNTAIKPESSCPQPTRLRSSSLPTPRSCVPPWHLLPNAPACRGSICVKGEM